MVSQIVFFTIAVIAALAMLLRWFGESFTHAKRLKMVPHRIHVNGIRGKSTVTRLIAGMLREADMVTVGKSTGSFAAVIDPDGSDRPLQRTGSPTILEQINVVRDWVTPFVDAIVMECMAINPRYQKVSEERIIRSTIGVITNVREDHQDVMGETLPEIARSLMSSCPKAGILVTAEQNPELLDIMFAEARKRGTSLIVADPSKVRPEEVAAFDYISFEENIAIVLAIAELLNITDSRFQLDLPREAQYHGKIGADYQIPEAYRHNTPQRLQAVYQGFKKLGLFPTFPFGSDFSLVEERLLPALGWLKENAQRRHLLKLARQTLQDNVHDHHFLAQLDRMGLSAPTNLKEQLYKNL